jgi:hypothetical protein
MKKVFLAQFNLGSIASRQTYISHMKAMPVIAALFAFICCAQGAESHSWDRLITRKHSEKELRTKPTITVQNTNRTTVMLLVENRTGVDIEYYGYSKATPQMFLKEKRDGKWVATSWDWCGTGMEKHVVKNGKSTHFEIQLTSKPVQIFTIFSGAKDPKEFSLVKLYERDGN